MHSYFAGPANTLFQKEYYSLMKKALRPGGIVCTQGKSGLMVKKNGLVG